MTPHVRPLEIKGNGSEVSYKNKKKIKMINYTYNHILIDQSSNQQTDSRLHRETPLPITKKKYLVDILPPRAI